MFTACICVFVYVYIYVRVCVCLCVYRVCCALHVRCTARTLTRCTPSLAWPQARLGKLCGSCGKGQQETGAPLKACTRCRKAFYCGASCQRAAWPQHKKTCRPARAGRAVGSGAAGVYWAERELVLMLEGAATSVPFDDLDDGEK